MSGGLEESPLGGWFLKDIMNGCVGVVVVRIGGNLGRSRERSERRGPRPKNP